MICFPLELLKLGQVRYTTALFDLDALIFCAETNEKEETGCQRRPVQKRDSNRPTCFIERDRSIVDGE